MLKMLIKAIHSHPQLKRSGVDMEIKECHIATRYITKLMYTIDKPDLRRISPPPDQNVVTKYHIWIKTGDDINLHQITFTSKKKFKKVYEKLAKKVK